MSGIIWGDGTDCRGTWGTFKGDGNVFYLESNGSYSTVCNCCNLSTCTVKFVKFSVPEKAGENIYCFFFWLWNNFNIENFKKSYKYKEIKITFNTITHKKHWLLEIPGVLGIMLYL